MMIKKLYQFLHPSKEQARELFGNIGVPLLLSINIRLMADMTDRPYDIWLPPNWTKNDLWERIQTIITPFEGWINLSEITLINTSI